jgi:tetratricopeptide (TPR) repeat protein
MRETDPKQHKELGAALNNLGVVRRWQGNYEDASKLMREGITLLELEVGKEHPMLIRPLNNLATVYALSGKSEEAEQTFEQVRQLCTATLGRDHPLYASVLANYAGYLRMRGRKAEAKKMEVESKTVAADVSRRNGAGMTVDVTAFREK